MPALIPRAAVTTRPDAQPQVRQTAQLDVSGVNAGVAKLGAVAQGFLEQKLQEADHARLEQARAELAAYGNSLSDPENAQGIASFRGENALKANETLLPQADQRISRIRQRLAPRQRAQFDGMAASWRSTLGESLNRHMAAEHVRHQVAQAEAINQTMSSEAVLHGLNGSPDLQQASVAELQAANQRRLELQGAPREAIALQNRVTASNVYAQTVTGLANRSIEDAISYYDKVSDHMTAEDRIRVESVVYPAKRQALGEAAAAAVLGGAPMPGDGYEGKSDGKAPPSIPPAIRSTIDAAADRYNVPRHIAYALAEQESGFRPDAVGPETKWGTAKGLFQYLDTTAQAMGIDPLDPAQASDAAMRQLSEQAEQHGWDWAIAHHHAGPNRAQHGPKTRTYVRQVQERSRRYAGQDGASQGYQAPAESKAEAIARLRADPVLQRDSVALKAAEAEVVRAFDLVDAQRQEAERKQDEQTNIAIDNGAADASLRDLAGPVAYARYVREGTVDAWEKVRLNRINRTFVQDDPAFVEQLAREAVTDPSAFLRRNFDDPRVQLRLATPTLAAFKKQQADFGKPGGQDDYHTQEQRLELAYAGLGITRDEKHKGAFRILYLQAERDLYQRLGRKPTPTELDALGRSTSRIFAQRMADGATGIYAEARKAVQSVPQADRNRVRDKYRRKHGHDPSEAYLDEFIERSVRRNE